MGANVRIKICGITNLKDARCAVESGAWAIGFIFYKKSPRYISPANAKKIMDQLPPFVTPIGVFVNETEATIRRIAKTCHLRSLQFHGDESPAFCRKFNDFRIIKAFGVDAHFDVKASKKYHVAALLFDTYYTDSYGGGGKAFHWRKLNGIKKSKIPIILSGGINPKNIRQAFKVVNPYAVDVSSGVEVSPGKKSEKLMKELFKAVSQPSAISFQLSAADS